MTAGTLRHSVAILGTRPTASLDVPCFRAYGEVDDHLRLSVLMADMLPGDPKAAEACKHPHLPWAQRKERWRDFLQTIRPSPSGRMAVFIDPDALHPGHFTAPISWDDSEFHRERIQAFGLLMEAAERGGWVLIRPSPKPERAQDMAAFAVEPQGETQTIIRESLHSALAPTLRPIVDWLLEEKVLDQRHASRIIRAAPSEDASQDFLELAYDHLRPSLREAAQQLCPLRPELSLNGHLGPYELTDSQVEGKEMGLRRSAVMELKQAGFLQQGINSSALLMPSFIRHFLAVRAEVRQEPQQVQRHLWLAQHLRDRQGTESVTEAHYHAIQARDVSLAESTATYYGNDLREIGVQLSHDSNYKDAAKVFECIVRKFDTEDAYAWEYLGYNLYRAAQRQLSESARAKIKNAFTRAYQLAPGNPLYHGRLLGFRALLGEDVENEIRQAISNYRLQGSSALTYFGEAALKGLRGHEKHRKLANTLLTQWPGLARTEEAN